MFTRLQPYDSYRAADTPWLPELPSHWASPRLKTVLVEKVVRGFPDEPLLAATQSRGVIRKSDYESRTVTAQKDLDLLKLVEVGDFVISLRSFQGGIERAHARGIISPAYTILEARDRGVADYLTLLFKSRPFVDALTLTVTGIREGQNIEYQRLARDLVPLPPSGEQAAIVKYLAHAHHRIDRAIAAKRKLSALLEEQKQAVINQAVTRGLDPTAPLKDSGGPSFGLIPAHWHISRIRYVLREVDVRTPDGIGRALSMSQRSGLVPSDQVSRSLGASSNVGNKVCDAGDIVMNRLKAHLGVFAVAPEAGLVSPDYTVLRTKQFNEPGYIATLLRSPLLRFELRTRVRGIVEGFWRLYTDDLFNIRLPVPPYEEQRAILAHVEGETVAVRAAIEHAHREIALLREFRARLTSDVVTGQVDVRRIATTLPDLDPNEAAVVAGEPVDDLLDQAAASTEEVEM